MDLIYEQRTLLLGRFQDVLFAQADGTVSTREGVAAPSARI